MDANMEGGYKGQTRSRATSRALLMLATASNPGRMRELGATARLIHTLVYDIPTRIESPLRHFRGDFGTSRGERRRGSWTLIIVSFVSMMDSF